MHSRSSPPPQDEVSGNMQAPPPQESRQEMLCWSKDNGALRPHCLRSTPCVCLLSPMCLSPLHWTPWDFSSPPSMPAPFSTLLLMSCSPGACFQCPCPHPSGTSPEGCHRRCPSGHPGPLCTLLHRITFCPEYHRPCGGLPTFMSPLEHGLTCKLLAVSSAPDTDKALRIHQMLKKWN